MLYEKTPALFHSVDSEGRLLNISDLWLKCLGYSREEVLGRDIASFMTEESRHQALKRGKNWMREGEWRNLERQYLTKDGDLIETLLSGVSERDENGEFTRSLSVSTDVTEHRRSEKALRDSEEQFATIINNLPAAAYLKDWQGHYQMVNRQFEEWYGAVPGETRGKTVYDFFPRELAEIYDAHDRAVMDTQAMSVRETTVIHVDGSAHICMVIKFPVFDSEGSPVGIGGVSADITERKQAEEALRASEKRYRALYEKTPIMLHSTDDQGRILNVSDQWIKRLGYSRQEVLGRTIFDFMTPESRLLGLGNIGKAMHAGSWHDLERQFVSKNGELVDGLISGALEYDENGALSQALSVLIDITDRKRAELLLGLRGRELTTLHEISEIALQGQTLKTALEEIVKVIGSATGFPVVTLELYERTDSPPPRADGEDDEPAALSGYVVRSDFPALEQGAAGSLHDVHAPRPSNMDTFIATPMIVGDRSIGILTLAHPEKITVDDSLPRWARTLANYVASLIERKRIEDTVGKPTGHRKRLVRRFLKTGEEGLQDEEMLELALYLARQEHDVRNVASRLLEHYGGFAAVVSADIQSLERQNLGEETIVIMKAIQAAAVRLARVEVMDRPVLGSWEKVLDYCRMAMAWNKIEELRLLFLDRENILIADEVQQSGTIDHTPVYPREIVKRALELQATAIIMVHNHPSGDPTYSDADIDMTNQVREAAEKLGITLHDHVIVARSGHFSFRSAGLLRGLKAKK
jgi:DNA repair protein RadC